MKILKNLIVLTLSACLIISQQNITFAKGSTSSRKGIVWDDDGYTQSNIDACSEYADYFYFKNDRVNVKVGEHLKISYFLDSSGFDDLGEFSLFIDNKEVATIDEGANTACCYVTGVAKGSTLLQAAYDGSLIASMCINVVNKTSSSSSTGIEDQDSSANSGNADDGEEDNSDSTGISTSNGSASSSRPDNNSSSTNINVSDGEKDNQEDGTDESGNGSDSDKPNISTDTSDSDKTILDVDNGSYSANVFKFAESSLALKEKGSKSVKYSLALYSDGDISFSSSNTNVATVKKLSNKEIKITAVGAGKATIVAKHNSLKDNMESKLVVTVTGSSKKEKKVTTAIKLNKTSASLAKVGSKITLKASVKGTGVTLPSDAKISWSSSNTKVAVVNSSGTVTAKKKGAVTITAKCTGKIGGKKNTSKATCKITVKK